jgi:hypothetical protein
VFGPLFRVFLVNALRLDDINFELGVLWWLFGSETLKPLNFEIFWLGFWGWELGRLFGRWVEWRFWGGSSCLMDFLEGFFRRGLEG